MLRRLPDALSALRCAFAPVLVALAWTGAGRAFVVCLALSLATDVADGRLARGLGLASVRGARLDSAADLLTWTSLPVCAWWLRPEFVRAEAAWFVAAVTSYVVPVLVGLARWGRLTSYHTSGARLAAWVGGASALVVFAGGPALAFRIAAVVLACVELEEIAITAVLPAWQADVPSLRRALELRRHSRSGSSSPGVEGA